MSAAAKLLDRLDGVRQTAPGRWIARCPAHEDRSPSLSVREIDDRVLVHDFGGCEVGDVLAAVGLGLADLFEKPLGNFPANRGRIPAYDLLEIASHEMSVAGILLSAVVQGRTLGEPEWQRLAQCARRIHAVRDHARG